MPFTLSHPAAAVPFTKCGLALSALVVGSLAPDFLYFFRLSASGDFGHTLPGLLLFDVPLGLAVLWVFHTVLKYPLLMLLPVSHQKRLLPLAQDFRFGPRRQFLLIILALMIGAMTHIIWDSSTHGSRWLVQNSPFLSAPLLPTLYSDLKVYKVLQHGSTLLGASVLIYWYVSWFNSASPQAGKLPIQLSSKMKGLLIGLMGLGALIFAVSYSFLNAPPLAGLHSFRPLVGRAVVATISALSIELLIFGAAWRFINLWKY